MEWYDSCTKAGVNSEANALPAQIGVAETVAVRVLLPLVKKQVHDRVTAVLNEGQRANGSGNELLFRAMDLGCGLSQIPILLAREIAASGLLEQNVGQPRMNFEILGVDCSAVAVERQQMMWERQQQLQQVSVNVKFLEADVLQNALPLANASVDLIWEKAFLDAMLSSYKPRRREAVESHSVTGGSSSEPGYGHPIVPLLQDCHRVLRKGSGSFVTLSRLSQLRNWDMLNSMLRRSIGEPTVEDSGPAGSPPDVLAISGSNVRCAIFQRLTV